MMDIYSVIVTAYIITSRHRAAVPSVIDMLYFSSLKKYDTSERKKEMKDTNFLIMDAQRDKFKKRKKNVFYTREM